MPHWRGNKIHLSGGEQVCIMLKSWYGSWEKFLALERRLIKIHGDYLLKDYHTAERIRDFERENNVRFRKVEGCDVEWIQIKRPSK